MGSFAPYQSRCNLIHGVRWGSNKVPTILAKVEELTKVKK